jgi:hypothetical protein
MVNDFLEVLRYAIQREEETVKKLILTDTREPAPEGWIKLKSLKGDRVIAVVEASDELDIISYYKGIKKRSIHLRL